MAESRGFFPAPKYTMDRANLEQDWDYIYEQLKSTIGAKYPAHLGYDDRLKMFLVYDWGNSENNVFLSYNQIRGVLLNQSAKRYGRHPASIRPYVIGYMPDGKPIYDRPASSPIYPGDNSFLHQMLLALLDQVSSLQAQMNARLPTGTTRPGEIIVFRDASESATSDAIP